MSGICLSRAAVSNITPHGFWLELGNEELYMPFVEFPWFEHITVAQLCQVQWAGSDHLYWPALDLDLTVAAIRNPAGFPLISTAYN